MAAVVETAAIKASETSARVGLGDMGNLWVPEWDWNNLDGRLAFFRQRTEPSPSIHKS